ncbi:MAG: toxin-antitoxin system antitoxin subunit [Flavonifractor plautii]
MKTLLRVAAAAAVGAAGWYQPVNVQNQIEHIRQNGACLAVTAEQLAALRSAAEEGRLDAPAPWGQYPWTGRRWSPSDGGDGAAVLSCGEGGGLAVSEPLGKLKCTPLPWRERRRRALPNIWAQLYAGAACRYREIGA